ncbi:MAG: hypothetical protein ACKPCM_15335 [Pseudanabaena sp.]
MKNIKGNANQLKTMLKLCSTHGWELKKVVSSRQKEGSHLFVGEVKAEFTCHRNKPKHAIGNVYINIRSDGTVDQGYHSDLHSELIQYFQKADITTEPTKNLGKGLR